MKINGEKLYRRNIYNIYINTTSSGYTKMFQRLWGNIAQRPIKRSLVVSLNSSPRKFYGHHHYLVNYYRVSVSQMTTDVLRIYDKTNTTGATRGAGTVYPFRITQVYHRLLVGFV